MNWRAVAPGIRATWAASALLLLACGPGQDAPAGAPPVTPQYGGVIQFAAIAAVNTLDLHREATLGPGANAFFAPIYEMLVENRQDHPLDDFRASGELKGQLAERWEQPDSLSYVFHIRRGVKWHPAGPGPAGQELSAHDVKFSFDRVRDPANNFTSGQDILSGVTAVDVVDDYTVKLTRRTPAPEFLRTLTGNGVAILPKHLADRGEDYGKVAAGTGPFKLQSFEPQKEMRHVRNDQYWQPGKPYANGIRVIVGLERSAVLAALNTGQVDFHNVTDKAQLDTILATKPDLKYHGYNAGFARGIRFKMTMAPYDDIRVRRAIHLAIDRQEMLQTLTFGVGGINQFTTSVVKDWTIPETDLMKLPGYRQPKEQDIAEAKRLLTEAGYPNGFKANLFYYSAFTDHPSLAEMVAGQLKRIGVEVSLKGMERATGAEANRQGAYEMTLFSNGMSEAPDSGLRSTWSSKGSVGRSSGLADPELDRLIDEQSVEMDRTKRVEILRKINQLAMDRVYLAPLVSGGYFTVWQPYLHNYYLNFSGTPRLDRPADAWLDVERMPQDRR